jgi:hypothetical protein
MRKFLSLVLCLVILFNVSGYYIAFKIMHIQARKEMKAYIKNNLDEDELEIIMISDSEISSASSSFRFIKKNEFTYKGKLYDIVHQKIEGSNTTFYCINDKKEEKLFANLDDHIKCHTDKYPVSKSRSAQLIKSIVKDALPEKKQILKSQTDSQNILYAYIVNLTEQFIPIILPPPEEA